MKNRLIENSESQGWSKELSVFWIILIGLLILILPSLVAMGILSKIDFLNMKILAGSSIELRNSVYQVINLFISFIGIHLSLFLFVKYAEKRPYSHIGLDGKDKGIKAIIGFVLGVVSIAIASIFVILLGDGGIGNTGKINMLPYVVIILVGWVIQASAEEFLFRGWIMPKVGKKYGIIVGILSSSIIFGLAHSGNPGVTILAVINIVLFGIFAGMYAIYEEGIIGVTAYHIAWNWAQGNLFGLNVSGSDSGVSFIKVTTNSENIFTGYGFGPEGGLVITIILLLSIIVLSNLLSRKKSLEEKKAIQ